jgi:hypothetical protein
MARRAAHPTGPQPDDTVAGVVPGSPDAGLSMLVTVISLLLSALLVLLVLKATITTGTGTGTASAPSAQVALADATEAQQNLATGLSTARSAADGGLASVDPSALESADPNLTFTSGPSTAPGTLSVDSSPGGAVTLAARASDGTCWDVWSSTTGGTWYGAQTGQASCPAADPTSAPTAGPVSSYAVGWQQGSFPAP